MASSEKQNESTIALMNFLTRVLSKTSFAKHTYIVGGAVRDFLLGKNIKDIDVVVDSKSLGATTMDVANHISVAINGDSEKEICNCVLNNYGVAIMTIKEDFIFEGVNLRKEVLEIATARAESYGGEEGKGYKPDQITFVTIEEDIMRRDFTINTLLWKLDDIDNAGGASADIVIDILKCGRSDLENRILRTPTDPHRTFSDDPSRLLRAVKFIARLDLTVEPNTRKAIVDQRFKMKKAPWNAIATIFWEHIIRAKDPLRALEILDELQLAEVVLEIYRKEQEFHAMIDHKLRLLDTSVVLALFRLGFEINFLWSLEPNDFTAFVNILETHPEKANSISLAMQKPSAHIDNRAAISELSLKTPHQKSILGPSAKRAVLQNFEDLDERETFQRKFLEIANEMLQNLPPAPEKKQSKKKKGKQKQKAKKVPVPPIENERGRDLLEYLEEISIVGDKP